MLFSALSAASRRLRCRPARASRSRRPFGPRLEALEDRCVPATLFVNSSADNVFQPGTLRYAVAHANNGDVIDILPLPTAPVGRHIVLLHGELYLNHSVTIQAVGPRATIDGDHFSRTFEVAPVAQVKLANLDLTAGAGLAHNPLGKLSLDGDGGAILNEGTLMVTGCTVTHDAAAKDGGGIYNDHGHVLVTSSALFFNSARDGGALGNEGGSMEVGPGTLFKNSAAQLGGGIFNQQGKLTVSGAALLQNAAGFDGGGIANVGGAVTVSNSNLSFNTALNGGGIYNDLGTLVVTKSLLNVNAAKLLGGGIANNRGAVTVTGSDLQFNTALNGGGIDNFLGSLQVGTSLFKKNVPNAILGAWTNLGGNTFV
jgi:hypothetical protein